MEFTFQLIMDDIYETLTEMWKSWHNFNYVRYTEIHYLAVNNSVNMVMAGSVIIEIQLKYFYTLTITL